MKTKFNPEDVPERAKWIAVDANGKCFAYNQKPIKGEIFAEWLPENCNNNYCVSLYKGKPPKNWETELYTWGY